MPVPFIFTILLGSLCTWVIFITILHVQAALISPLRRVPGPWYASVSDIWLIAQFLRFRQAQAIHELFQRYGPIVRIGPRKVVFCDLDSLRSVYLIQRFDKSPLYKHFAMLVEIWPEAISSLNLFFVTGKALIIGATPLRCIFTV
jgi:hypothetical protein